MQITKVIPPLWGLIWAGVQALLVWQAGGRRFRGQKPVATAFALATVGLAAAAVRELRRHGTQLEPMDPSKSTAVVSSGIYGYTRNPMYLALTLGLTAGAVWAGRLRALLGVAGFVACVTPQIHAEERALTTTFGDTYLLYQARVRRWL